ncbi:hypothetical protein [Arthrobacter sp. D3-16]
MFIISNQRAAKGSRGPDAGGPAMDEIGKVDPWEDLWFYTNPIFVEVSD